VTFELQALAITEAQFQQRVIDLATLTGWHVTHFRAVFTGGRWRTPLTGHAGAPDLVLARGGRVILAELKTERGRLTAEQKAWLAALGPHGRIWRPSDWQSIVAELKRMTASSACRQIRRSPLSR
jgi:hypothetical protein